MPGSFVPTAKTSVLLVGCDEETRTTLTALLEGCDVSAVDDAPQALLALEAGRNEIVVVDHDRSPGGGPDLTRQMKRYTAATEIIVIAACADLALALACLRAGAVDFFPKPIDCAGILAAVDRIAYRQTSERLLREASHAILSTKEIERLPKAIVELTMRAMRADDVSLMLLDDDGKLYVAYSHGQPPSVGAVSVSLDDSIAGRVARDGEPALISDSIAEDPRFAGISPSDRVHSSIVYPLSSEQRLTGVLNISRTSDVRKFDANDMPRAAFLASQALLALENARLVRRIVVSERMAAIGQLASGFAHEISNPLSFLLMNISHAKDRLEPLSDLLSMPRDGERQDAIARWLGDDANLAGVLEVGVTLDEARSGGLRIRDLVGDLKNFASVAKQHRAEFDLNDAVGAALRIAGSIFRKDTKVDTYLGEGARIFGGLGQLSQVFLNLLVNAAHALECRGAKGHLTIRTSVVGGRALAEISDNGSGIAPENQRRIFEAFFTTKPFGKGTGLGLSISREIVRRHGGELRVDSIAGKGATFTVSLPLVAG